MWEWNNVALWVWSMHECNLSAGSSYSPHTCFPSCSANWRRESPIILQTQSAGEDLLWETECVCGSHSLDERLCFSSSMWTNTASVWTQGEERQRQVWSFHGVFCLLYNLLLWHADDWSKIHLLRGTAISLWLCVVLTLVKEILDPNMNICWRFTKSKM